MKLKINKQEILEEVAQLIYPLIKNDIDSIIAKTISNKQDLQNFKKSYPNYKTMDTFKDQAVHSAKVMGTVGAAVGAYYGLDDDDENPLITTAAGGLISAGLGGIGAGLNRGLSKITKKEDIKDIISRKEKIYK